MSGFNNSMQLVQDPQTPAATLDLLSREESDILNRLIARHQNASPETLERLSTDLTISVVLNVAKNPNTSPKTLAALSKNPTWLIRMGVAENENAPAEILEKLLKDESPAVVAGALKNRNTPIEIVTKFIDDAEELHLILPALNNPQITKEICAELSKKCICAKYKLYCLMMEDIFQCKYDFSPKGSIFIVDDGGECHYVENILGRV